MPPTEKDRKAAHGRIDRIGTIFWGEHDPAVIVERVLADYALIGKVPIDRLKQRAKKRVEGLNAPKS